jgi:hypothetical protein
MGLGILIMWIIIIITLAVVGAVLYYGVQHDPHTSIRSVESSQAVEQLNTQAAAAQRKLQAMQPAKEEAPANDAPEEKKADAKESASQLGDDEARRKRREAALARKAARQKAQQETKTADSES